MSEHMKIMTPAASLLGRRLVSVDESSGEVQMAFTARADFANRHGSVHGGMLSAMLDSAAANAVMVGLAPGMAVLTMRLDTRFHRPAPLGELRSASRVVERDERSATVEAELYSSDGTKLTSARVSFRLRPAKPPVQPAAGTAA